MADKVKVFLDTSALFAGIWSEAGGARMILKLGEAGAVQILVSSQVLAELEAALRQKAPTVLAHLALLLDRSQIEVVPPAGPETIALSETLTNHPGDAKILADAWAAGPHYLVTLDRQHFLENVALRTTVPFPLGAPGDFLAWYKSRVSSL